MSAHNGFKPAYMDLTGILAEPDEPPDWLWTKLLERGDNAFIFGDGYSGKTYVGLSLAVSAAAGLPAFEHKQFACPRKLRVLFIDEEMRPSKTRKRIRRLARGLKVSEDDLRENFHLINRSRFSLSNSGSMGWLLREVGRLAIDVVFVDSFIQVCDVDENKSKEVKDLLAESASRLQNETGIGMVIMDHTRKPQGRESKNYANAQRGSKHKYNHFETVWSLQKEKAPGLVRVRFILEKGREVGPKDETHPFFVDFEDRTDGSIRVLYAGEVQDNATWPARWANAIKVYADAHDGAVIKNKELREATAPKSKDDSWKKGVALALAANYVRPTEKRGYYTLHRTGRAG